jgi:glycosyltransferase involved in cell wall biosynthesis
MTAALDLSVVIPSYARPEPLARCMEALSKVRLEGSFEVIVVDDGSPTPLAPVIEKFADRVPARVLRQANKGPAAARNAGARAAIGRLLAFTDDDCLPEPDWLSALAKTHAQQPLALIGGRVSNALPDNIYSATSQDLVDYLYDYFGAETGDAPFFTSNNMACERARFIELGGFDESFPLAAAEDRELGMRWRDRGGALVYAPDAVVGHAHALSLQRYWRQHANYGRGARHLHRVRMKDGLERPKFERLSFYTGLVSYPLRRRSPRALPKSALMALSQLAMTYGFTAQAMKEAGR